MDYKRYENGGTDVVIPIPRSYADCWQLVRSDYLRYKRTILVYVCAWPRIAVGRTRCSKSCTDIYLKSKDCTSTLSAMWDMVFTLDTAAGLLSTPRLFLAITSI